MVRMAWITPAVGPPTSRVATSTAFIVCVCAHGVPGLYMESASQQAQYSMQPAFVVNSWSSLQLFDTVPPAEHQQTWPGS